MTVIDTVPYNLAPPEFSFEDFEDFAGRPACRVPPIECRLFGCRRSVGPRLVQRNVAKCTARRVPDCVRIHQQRRSHRAPD
jgi:hypothetical protein